MKLFSLIISLLILFQSSALTREVFQLDAFWAHARFHQQQMGDSIWDFIRDHYSGEETHHHDGQEHEQLPFHGEYTFNGMLLIFLLPLLFHFPRICLILPREQRPDFYYIDSYKSLQITEIIKPPRWLLLTNGY